jgi:VWFA-related protein
VRAILALALALVGASTASSQEVPTFATSVESVYVDVWVGHGATPLRELTAADFEVRDDGVPQQVEVVDTSHVPLHAVLVLDTSASVAGPALESLKAAARAFLAGLASDDRATLVTFSHVRRLGGPMAATPEQVSAALDAVAATGTTALRDAVFTGIELADPRRGRNVLMVFSDGGDRVSFLDETAVETAARETEVTIYVVDSAGRADKVYARGSAFPTPFNVGGSSRPDAADTHRSQRTTIFRAHETAPFLRHLAEETGGQVFRTDSAAALDESFLGVLARVKGRYLLRYEPVGVRAGGWHKLEVRLKGRQADVSARRGYLAPAHGSP